MKEKERGGRCEAVITGAKEDDSRSNAVLI